MLPGDPGSAPATPKSIQEQVDGLTDAENKISPLTFPDPSVSPEYVNSMASGLRSVGASISETGSDITGAWSGLRECYTAPETDTLFAVLDPVATDGDEVSDALADAATALETFADNVESIKSRWSSLRIRAYDLLSRIEAEGDDWRKAEGWDRVFGNDNDLVEENAALVRVGERIIDDYAEFETECAGAINKGVPDRTTFAKTPEGGGDLDEGVFYHGYEQDLSELATEWGSEPAGTDHGWWVDAGAAVWDFGVGAVEGTGAMLGAHSSEGWFNQSWGDSLKEYHMDNIQSAASLVGLYDNETGEFGRASKESVKGAWKDLAHSVVPWEEWGERPGYVIGTALLNVGAMVGGAVLTATGVGAVVGVPLMAWRGMAIVDGMGSSGRGGSGTDIPDMPTFGGAGGPVVNVDTSNFTPAQAAEVSASLERLNASTGGGAGGAGGSGSSSGESGSGSGGRSNQPGSSSEPDSKQSKKQASSEEDVDPETAGSEGSAEGDVSGGRSDGDESAGTTAESPEASSVVSEDAGQNPRVGDVVEADRVMQTLADSYTPEQRAGYEAGERTLAGRGVGDHEQQGAGSSPSKAQVDEQLQNNPEFKQVGATLNETASSYPGFWEGNPGASVDKGPDQSGRPLVPAGNLPDPNQNHAQNQSGSDGQRVDLRDGSGERSNADRSGDRDSSTEGPTGRGEGPQARDHGPTAVNQDHSGTPSTRDDTSGNSHDGLVEANNQGGNSSSAGGRSGDHYSDSTSQTTSGSNNGSGSSPFHSQESLSAKWSKVWTIEGGQSSGPRINDGAKGVLPDNELKNKKIGQGDEKFSPHPNERFGDGEKLEPNTKYEVTDKAGSKRGVYTTDANGEVRRIKLTVTDFSAKHPEFSSPRPNAEYQIDTGTSTYRYETNMYGRNLESEGQFTRSKTPRISTEETSVTRAAKDYYKAYNKMLKEDFSQNPEKYPGLTNAPQFENVTWNGGHVVGIGEFGGIPERLNQVAMLKGINQHSANEWRPGKSYRDFEQGMVSLLDGDFDRLTARARDFEDTPKGRVARKEYLEQVAEWRSAYELSPPPPDIRVKVSQAYDSSLPEFEIARQNGNVDRVLSAPPSSIHLEYTINGQMQESIRYTNKPKLK